MLSSRTVLRIKKMSADHKGTNATFLEQADGLGQKIVVYGKLAQFRIFGVEKALLAKRRIADNNIKHGLFDIDVLKSVVDELTFGIARSMPFTSLSNITSPSSAQSVE